MLTPCDGFNLVFFNAAFSQQARTKKHLVIVITHFFSAYLTCPLEAKKHCHCVQQKPMFSYPLLGCTLTPSNSKSFD